MNRHFLCLLAMPPTSPFSGLREIQPGVFPEHQLGDAISRPGRVPGAVEYPQMMFPPVDMDVSLIAIRVPDLADADVSGGVGTSSLLIEGVLLVRHDPQVAPAIIQLVAVDMIDLALYAGI